MGGGGRRDCGFSLLLWLGGGEEYIRFVEHGQLVTYGAVKERIGSMPSTLGCWGVYGSVICGRQVLWHGIGLASHSRRPSMMLGKVLTSVIDALENCRAIFSFQLVNYKTYITGCLLNAVSYA